MTDEILVDDNIRRMTLDGLRELGHDVRDVRDSADQGCHMPHRHPGSAIRETWLLITTDKGFTQYRAMTHSGILIVRPTTPRSRT